MEIRNKVEKIIFDTIEEVNNQLNIKMEKSLSTRIIGGDSQLDSMGVFTFILELENLFELEFNKQISLINNDFLEKKSEHLNDIKLLQNYLINILIEE